MNKITAVLTVLEQNPTIRAWYEAEHGLVVADLTHSSVRTHGTGGHGDIADMILDEPEAAAIAAQLAA